MNCEDCVYYDYDEEDDCYYCTIDLDQDDMERLLTHKTKTCPFYRYNDEYYLARKQ